MFTVFRNNQLSQSGQAWYFTAPYPQNTEKRLTFKINTAMVALVDVVFEEPPEEKNWGVMDT